MVSWITQNLQDGFPRKKDGGGSLLHLIFIIVIFRCFVSMSDYNLITCGDLGSDGWFGFKMIQGSD